MKKFLIRCCLLGGILLVSMVIVLMLGDGYTDAFYVRFTTPPQKSLILGDSRSAQGIMPSILNSEMGRDDFFNYSFTIMDSPYGPTYLKSIKKKLDPETLDGIFIITVNPWVISSLCDPPDDTLQFRELAGCLAETNNVNLDPNIPYLINAFDKHYFNLLVRNEQMFLHDDGWLEMTVNMDQKSVERRTTEKISSHQTMAREYQLSRVRVEFLCSMIKFLHEHGDVYLVRLPVDPRIRRVEDAFMPDLAGVLQEPIAASNGYLDMENDGSKCDYLDGSHLYKASAAEVSQKIAGWIENMESPQLEEISATRAIGKH